MVAGRRDSSQKSLPCELKVCVRGHFTGSTIDSGDASLPTVGRRAKTWNAATLRKTLRFGELEGIHLHEKYLEPGLPSISVVHKGLTHEPHRKKKRSDEKSLLEGMWGTLESPASPQPANNRVQSPMPVIPTNKSRTDRSTVSSRARSRGHSRPQTHEYNSFKRISSPVTGDAMSVMERTALHNDLYEEREEWVPPSERLSPCKFVTNIAYPEQQAKEKKRLESRPGTVEAYALERTIVQRLVQSIDMGKFPKSRLLDMIHNRIIPVRERQNIEKEVENVIEELSSSVEQHRQPNIHVYRDLVTDTENNSVLSRYTPNSRDLVTFYEYGMKDSNMGELFDGMFTRKEVNMFTAIMNRPKNKAQSRTRVYRPKLTIDKILHPDSVQSNNDDDVPLLTVDSIEIEEPISDKDEEIEIVEPERPNVTDEHWAELESIRQANIGKATPTFLKWHEGKLLGTTSESESAIALLRRKVEIQKDELKRVLEQDSNCKAVIKNNGFNIREIDRRGLRNSIKNRVEQTQEVIHQLKESIERAKDFGVQGLLEDEEKTHLIVTGATTSATLASVTEQFHEGASAIYGSQSSAEIEKKLEKEARGGKKQTMTTLQYFLQQSELRNTIYVARQ